eukprot:Seg3862.4 transcript_id=Seg3862.4/GoldUCD/mRNA.D3Y31 product="hypothetical protein" protein_id=Seg3862.4/GoldUCD/D3Y31
MKANAWKQLAGIFHRDVTFLQKTLKNLKDNLKRCLDRRRALTRSGAAYSTLPTCKYFDLMAFLHERTENKPTDSNIQSQIMQDSQAFTESLSAQQSSLNTQVIDSQLLNQREDSQTLSQSQMILQRAIPPTPSPSYSAAPSPCSSVGSVDAGIISPTSSERRKGTKRKLSAASISINSDAMFLQQMKDFDEKIIHKMQEKREEPTEVCEDALYCKSLIPVLRGLPLRKKTLAKVKISSLLYDIEFGNDSENI